MELTASQNLLWLGQRLDPASPLYNMAFAFHIFGPVDPERFDQAFASMVARRDALRMVVEDRGGDVRLRYSKAIEPRVEFIDFSMEEDAEAALRSWAQRRTELPFNLERQLFYSALVRLGPTHHVWYLNQHHLITDAWSCEVIFREVSAAYTDASLAARVPAFSDYIDRARAPAHESKLEFWRNYPRARPLTFYGRPVTRRTGKSYRQSVVLDAETVTALRDLTRGAGALTPNIAFFCGIATAITGFISRITRQPDILLGVLNHNRTRALREAVGMYVETGLLNTSVRPRENFKASLARTISAFQESLNHLGTGITAATGESNCQIILNYLPFSFAQFAHMPVHVDWLHANSADVNHLLRCQVHDFSGTGGLTLLLDMNEAAFGPDERALLGEQLERFLQSWISRPETPLGSVMLQDAEALARRIDANNETTRAWHTPSLPGLLGKLGDPAYADRPAVRQAGTIINYGALDRASSVLANHLLDCGVGVGSVVAVLTPPSIEAVIAVTAVLKSGAAFAALDPLSPRERNSAILRELAAAEDRPLLLLSSTGEELDLEMLPVERINVDIASGGDVAVETPAWERDLDDLCYVLYTSGSTGRPKGVQICDKGLINYLNWALRQYVVDGAADMPLFTSLSFDLTLTSLFLPLVGGGCIHVHQGDPLLALPQILSEDRVDLIKLTPSHLALLKPHQFSQSRLKAVILGGETLERSLAARADAAWKQRVAIYNEYGPTETVIGCMVHRFDSEVDEGDSVPIGLPIDNMQAYVLDDNQANVAQGLVGELCIGGIAVALGYLNRPDLTAERFIENPFRKGERLYRTGDLARLNGAAIEFLGRQDRQIKLHGYRIELDEISAALSLHPAVRQAAVSLTRLTGQETFCRVCGLSSNYPTADLDADDVCGACRHFDEIRDRIEGYFGSLAELEQILARHKQAQTGRYTCIVLLSGGKDSTYMLYRLAELELNLLAVTLDNGFISDIAKRNIERVTQSLNVDHLYLFTEHMNEIFADSLARHSNVCNGCFKTIYTLSMKLAREHDVRCIVTGLARGQLFETRLVDMCYTGEFDPARIDETIRQARRAYHKIPDAPTRLLPTKHLEDERIFDEIEFVDFYRYCDVPLADVYAFLDENAPWIRPQDTGRSTNCTVNDTGIYVHQLEQGYHNYALPYSWDVRLGHKTREAAMYELDDRIDVVQVQDNLRKFGYQPQMRKAKQSLTAFFTADAAVDTRDLRAFLSESLPQYMLPTHFVQLGELPLTSNGKVDYDALPAITRAQSVDLTPPRTDAEALLVEVWVEQFGMNVGTLDDFFELGGDSVIAVQMIDLIEERGYQVDPREIFEHPTIQALAPHLVAVTRKQTAAEPFEMVDLDDAARDRIAAALDRSKA